MSRFSQGIKAYAEKVGAGIDEVAAGAIIETSTRIIKRTPVGDPSSWDSPPPAGYIGGRARGNWFVTIDAPSTEISSNTDASGAGAISDVTAKAASALGHVFYLTNNLPYIGRLEYQGWSKQAPAGMVRVSVLEFNDALTKAITGL